MTAPARAVMAAPPRRRVVVSGLGVVSPYGAGVKALWAGLAGGACMIRPVTLMDPEGFRARSVAEVSADAMSTLPASRRRSRADRMALAAAAEAVASAGLSRAERVGAALVVGAVGGGMYEAEAWYEEEWRQGRPSPRVRALRSILPRAHADLLAWRLGIHGPRETLVMACASGGGAIAAGASLIRAGVVEVALVGGVDAFTRICFMGFNALKLLDPAPCRPFDRHRRGMSLGEGAAFLVLEEAGHCRARGVSRRAELAGAAMSTDAHHVTSPDPQGEGMIRAMRLALADARLDPGDVGYVSAHGTGTVQNDAVEGLALERVFGAGGVLVSSIKAMVGHTMAAAGSVGAVATVLALEHGLIPPTVTLEEPDPAIPFDCVPGTARAAALEAAASNSFGFGGQNVTLVFTR